uniref:Uncharacterized protein n=1 Tax=Solanum lycopersicum TaxID=4081 RepID=A0A3Q7FI68_SOLLC
MNYGYGNRSAKHVPWSHHTLSAPFELGVSKVYQFGFMVANVAQETYGSLKNMTVCFALTVYINHVDMLRLCFYIYTGHSGVSQDSV